MPTNVKQAPEPVWVKSKWTAEQLDGKTVEFRIQVGVSSRVAGVGVFRALTKSSGLSRIEIVVDQQGRNAYERVQQVFFCPQVATDLIERQSEGAQYDFSLFQV